MADSKLTALTEVTALDGDEQFYVVDDDDGIPTSKRITVENLKTGLGVPVLYQAFGSGAGNYSSSSTSYVNIDGTNLSISVTAAVGDVLFAEFNCCVYNGAAQYVHVDINVDRPTSADILLHGTRGASNGILQHNGGVAAAVTGRGSLTVTEAGVHVLKPQYKVSGNTGYVMNGSASEDVLPMFTVWHIPA